MLQRPSPKLLAVLAAFVLVAALPAAALAAPPVPFSATGAVGVTSPGSVTVGTLGPALLTVSTSGESLEGTLQGVPGLAETTIATTHSSRVLVNPHTGKVTGRLSGDFTLGAGGVPIGGGTFSGTINGWLVPTGTPGVYTLQVTDHGVWRGQVGGQPAHGTWSAQVSGTYVLGVGLLPGASGTISFGGIVH